MFTVCIGAIHRARKRTKGYIRNKLGYRTRIPWIRICKKQENRGQRCRAISAFSVKYRSTMQKTHRGNANNQTNNNYVHIHRLLLNMCWKRGKFFFQVLKWERRLIRACSFCPSICRFVPRWRHNWYYSFQRPFDGALTVNDTLLHYNIHKCTQYTKYDSHYLRYI